MPAMRFSSTCCCSTASRRLRRSRETPATEAVVGFDADCWLAETPADSMTGPAETPADTTRIRSAMVLSLGISGLLQPLGYDGTTAQVYSGTSGGYSGGK